MRARRSKLSTVFFLSLVAVLAWTPSAAAVDLSSGLLVHYAFDDGSGDVATDSSGNGRDGSLVNSPTWVVESKVGGCLEFSGSGDHVVDEDGEDYLNGLDALTVAMWIKSDVTGTDKGFFICQDPDGNDSSVTIRYDAVGYQSGVTNCLKVGVTATDGEQQLESCENLQDTDWQHVTLTWESGGLTKLYVNGMEDTPASRADPNMTGTVTGATTMMIGRGGKDTGTTRSWDGLIDEVRIYNRALSSEEIKWLPVLTDGACAGPDQMVKSGQTVTLDGSNSAQSVLSAIHILNPGKSASLDGVNPAEDVTYEWKQTDGPPVALDDPYSLVTTFRAPEIWEPMLELGFQLEITPELAEISLDRMIVYILNPLWGVEPLGPGYFKEMLHLGSTPDDRILLWSGVHDIDFDHLMHNGGEANQNPMEGQQYFMNGIGVDVTQNPMVWTPVFNEGGFFATGSYDNAEQYFHLNVISPEAQEARNRFRNDDEIRAWNNGTLSFARDAWDGGKEQFEDITLVKGVNSMTSKLEEDAGGNHLAARLTDRNNVPTSNLAYALSVPNFLPAVYSFRILPDSYEPDVPLEVRLYVRANPDGLPTVVDVKEVFPAGLEVADAGGGVVTGNEIRWDNYELTVDDRGIVTITYTVSVPAGTEGVLDIAGTCTYGSVTGQETYGDKKLYPRPSAPRNLRLKMGMNAVLTWEAPPEKGVASYEIWVQEDGHPLSPISETATNSVVPVKPGHSYEFLVCAINEAGVPGNFARASVEATMEIREAEDYNFSGGQYPGHQNCLPANLATGPDDLDPSCDFYFDNPNFTGPNAYRPADHQSIRNIGTDENPLWILAMNDFPGNWWRYGCNVPEPGPEDPPGGHVQIEIRVASPNGGIVDLYWDEVYVGSVSFVTGGWRAFEVFSLPHTFATTPGEHVLRVEIAGGKANIDTIGVAYNQPPIEAIFQDDFEGHANLYEIIGSRWTVVNGSGDPNATFRLWDTSGDPIGGTDPNLDGMNGNYAITISLTNPDADMNEELITPILDCTGFFDVYLYWAVNYRPYEMDSSQQQTLDLGIRVSENGTTWSDWLNLTGLKRTNVFMEESGGQYVNIAPYADGKYIQLRWYYYDAEADFWVALDNIIISGTPVEEPTDTTPPEITLSGENPLTLEAGTPYDEPGYTATDDVDEDITANVVVTGTVDHTTVGTYELRYNVSDSSGNPAEERLRTVNVVDTTPPVIVLLGDNPLTLECGEDYVDPGCTATDECCGDLTTEVVVTGSVDCTALGTYTLYYNVSDGSGNAAVEKTRTVNVVDTTAPDITLLGDNLFTLELGTPFEDPGWTATDFFDIDLTADVIVTGTVDHTTEGTYYLNYNVSDSSGNAADEEVRTVEVVETPPPVSTACHETWISWDYQTPFERPPLGELWWFREWTITVHARQHWNDAHFWFTSNPRIRIGWGMFGPAPPGFSPYAIFWWGREVTEGAPISYESPETGETVTTTATKLTFYPPTEGFGWGPEDWVFPACSEFQFSVSTNWYYNKEDVPGADDVIHELTFDGGPLSWNTPAFAPGTASTTQIAHQEGYDAVNSAEHAVDFDFSTAAVVSDDANLLVLDLGTERDINHLTVLSVDLSAYSNPALIEVCVGSEDDGTTFDQSLGVLSFPPANQGTGGRDEFEPVTKQYFRLEVLDLWNSESELNGSAVGASFAELTLNGPNEFASVPLFTDVRISYNDAEGVAVGWQSAPGSTYTIYYTDGPLGESTVWTPVLTLEGTGTPMEWIDDGTQTGTHPAEAGVFGRFYKIAREN
ncbi:DUF5011 domain-containing protein [bacterium]|nr:DUF5011 domain-containing protein [bacterium]